PGWSCQRVPHRVPPPLPLHSGILFWPIAPILLHCARSHGGAMRLIDLSQPIFDGCPNCPAHPPVRVTLGATHEQHGWRLELLQLASHTGSHVDAPLHKLAGGSSLDELPLDRFVGEALIVDLRDATPLMPIGPELLGRNPPPP